MQRIEAIEEYNRAQRSGMRDYREKTAAGKYPYLPALDELLEKTDTESQIPLGTIEIPLDYVVGTKTTGRTMAFASNFMPLLPEDTEFASKWLSLCMAHMEEGIHDAIKAYEYMGRFYVQEGNKRVSVLKYFARILFLPPLPALCRSSMIRRKFVNITSSWSITLCAGCTGCTLRRRAALPACRKRWAKRRMKSGPQTIRRKLSA